MSQRAFVERGAAEVAPQLTRLGWDVVAPEAAPLESLAEPPDLLVGAISARDAGADLRRLAALHAMAPDLPLVVVAERLDDGAGHAAYEVLIDVPIIRRGSEQKCLAAAIAAA